MNKNSTKKSSLSRWTRDGILDFPWSPFETFEKLILTPALRNQLTQRVETFVAAEKDYHALHLPWRHGLFFFGPSGCGKTAASKALARALDWQHLTIPAHEILDAHLLERAFSETVARSQRVIVLEDVDQMVRSMEPEVFFTLLDHAMERAEGTFWVANSRHPEDAPKIQLLRPGRFDEAIRLEPPSTELRVELLKNLFYFDDLDEASLAEWVEQTEGLTFAHFEELRRITARMELEKQDRSLFLQAIKSYVDDQMIAGDRWGGSSDSTIEVQERVRQIDTRVLTAALDMTDVFRRLIEKVIGDAAEEAKLSKPTSH